MMDSTGGKVLGAATRANYYLSNLGGNQDGWHVILIILDIIIVTSILYWIYILFRETRGIRIIYGIIVLVLLTGLGKYLQLSAFNFILKYLSTMIIVAIPIVLQPELRSALERLGRANIVSDVGKLKKRDIEQLLDNIVESVKILAKQQIGALIVIGRQTGLRDYLETGTMIDGAVSTELLLTLFSPKTPLHDGAVIIVGNKLVAAGCTLPLSDAKLNFTLGTRHRAALGMAAQTDALVIVVSEEKGQVSLALDGKLHQNIDINILRDRLGNELHEFRLAGKEKS